MSDGFTANFAGDGFTASRMVTFEDGAEAVADHFRGRLEREMAVQQLLTLREPSTVFTDTFRNSHNASLFIHPNENLREPWPQEDEIGADQGYRPPDWKLVAGRDDVYILEVAGR